MTSIQMHGAIGGKRAQPSSDALWPFDGVTLPSLRRGTKVLFKKLFRLLVVGGAVVGAHASCNCATGSSAKSSEGASAARGGSADMNAADGGTTSSTEPSPSSGGGVMGW
jgi:hypothetical protein